MAYDLVEHRHRFSVWAAARAAQRKLKGGTVGVLGEALDQSGVVAFARAKNGPFDQRAFDEAHRAWCRSSVEYLASRDVNASFGRAAKLVAIYLKSMVILNDDADTSQARVVHPPIDSILLRSMCKATDVESTHKTTWRKVRWTALNEDEYYKLIHQLRACVVEGDPFWTLERYWTAMDDQERGPSFADMEGTPYNEGDEE
jgi:hypothetical protein